MIKLFYYACLHIYKVQSHRCLMINHCAKLLSFFVYFYISCVCTCLFFFILLFNLFDYVLCIWVFILSVYISAHHKGASDHMGLQ